MHAAVQHRHRDENRQDQQECGAVEQAHYSRVRTKSSYQTMPEIGQSSPLHGQRSVRISMPSTSAGHGEVQTELPPFICAVWKWIGVCEALRFVTGGNIDKRADGGFEIFGSQPEC